MTGTDRDWMEQAACLTRTDLDWFDVDCYLQACLEVCVTCPVADDCLAYARRNDITDGVWGGEWGNRLTNRGRGVRGYGDRGRGVDPGYRGEEGEGD
jgi:hypothetical protein